MSFNGRDHDFRSICALMRSILYLEHLGLDLRDEWCAASRRCYNMYTGVDCDMCPCSGENYPITGED